MKETPYERERRLEVDAGEAENRATRVQRTAERIRAANDPLAYAAEVDEVRAPRFFGDGGPVSRAYSVVMRGPWTLAAILGLVFVLGLARTKPAPDELPKVYVEQPNESSASNTLWNRLRELEGRVAELESATPLDGR